MAGLQHGLRIQERPKDGFGRPRRLGALLEAAQGGRGHEEAGLLLRRFVSSHHIYIYKIIGFIKVTIDGIRTPNNGACKL